MKIILRNRSILLGISTGLFIGSLLVFLFATLFSYTHETNLVASIMFTTSLFIFYMVETAKQATQVQPSKMRDNKFSRTILVSTMPVICSILLIQGDIRSWFLVIISILLTWVIIK